MALPLLAVSGPEVVAALQRAGFRVITRPPGGGVVLHHGYRDVFVPVGAVGQETLRQLLRSAGLSYTEFLDLLEPVSDERFASRIRTRAVLAAEPDPEG